MLDPIAPVAGGEGYEPTGPRGRIAGSAPTIDNPYIEALYGESTRDGGSVIVQGFIGDRPRAPGDPGGGSPEALGGIGGSVVAVSAGVRGGAKSSR